MSNLDPINKNKFIYQHHKYRGKFTLNNLAFNANLQEFSQQVCYICNLQAAGKLSSHESYKQIEALWQQLENSFHTLITQKNLDF